LADLRGWCNRQHNRFWPCHWGFESSPPSPTAPCPARPGCRNPAPSSSGLGRRPLKAVTAVRICSGLQVPVRTSPCGPVSRPHLVDRLVDPVAGRAAGAGAPSIARRASRTFARSECRNPDRAPRTRWSRTGRESRVPGARHRRAHRSALRAVREMFVKSTTSPRSWVTLPITVHTARMATRMRRVCMEEVYDSVARRDGDNVRTHLLGLTHRKCLTSHRECVQLS
jgi:hypothetical protein